MYRDLNTSILGNLYDAWSESVHINPKENEIRFGFGFNESNDFIDKEASKDLNFIYKKEKKDDIDKNKIYRHEDRLLLDYISI
jgi:hypothetical protein